MKNQAGGGKNPAATGVHGPGSCGRGSVVGSRAKVPPLERASKEDSNSRPANSWRPKGSPAGQIEKKNSDLNSQRKSLFGAEAAASVLVLYRGACDTTDGGSTTTRGVRSGAEAGKTLNENQGKCLRANASLTQTPPRENVPRAKPNDLAARKYVLPLKKGKQAAPYAGCASPQAVPEGSTVKLSTNSRSASPSLPDRGGLHAIPGRRRSWGGLDISISTSRQEGTQDKQRNCLHTLRSNLVLSNDKEPASNSVAVSKGWLQPGAPPAGCASGPKKSGTVSPDFSRNESMELSSTSTVKTVTEQPESLGGEAALLVSDDIVEEEKSMSPCSSNETEQCAQQKRMHGGGSLATTGQLEIHEVRASSKVVSIEVLEEEYNGNCLENEIVTGTPRNLTEDVIIADMVFEGQSSRHSPARRLREIHSRGSWEPVSDARESRDNRNNLTREDVAGELPSLHSMIERLEERLQTLALRDTIIEGMMQRCIDQWDSTRRLLLAIVGQLLEQKEYLAKKERQLQHAEAAIRYLERKLARRSTADFIEASNVSTLPERDGESVEWAHCSVQDPCTRTILPMSCQVSSPDTSRRHTDDAGECREEFHNLTATLGQPATSQTTGMSPSENLEAREPGGARLEHRDTALEPARPLLSAGSADASCENSSHYDDWLYTAGDSVDNSQSTGMPSATLLRRHLSPPQDHDQPLEPPKAEVDPASRSPFSAGVVETCDTLTHVDELFPKGAVKGSVQTSPGERAPPPPLARLHEPMRPLQSNNQLSRMPHHCSESGSGTVCGVISVIKEYFYDICSRARRWCKQTPHTWFTVAACAVTGISGLISRRAPTHRHICFSPYCPGCCIPPGSPSSPLFLMRQNLFLSPHVLTPPDVAAVGLFHPSFQ